MTLNQKLKQLPKRRQRKIAARAKALIAQERRRLDYSDIPASTPKQLAAMKRRLTLGRAYAVLDHATGDRRGHQYRCPHCQRIVRRASTKAWITSYCDRTDRVVHLQRVGTVTDALIEDRADRF